MQAIKAMSMNHYLDLTGEPVVCYLNNGTLFIIYNPSSTVDVEELLELFKLY